MSEEQAVTQAAPEGETAASAPALDVADTGTAENTTPETEQQAEEAKPEGDPEPKKTPWFQKRIDDLTREKYEARREAEAYRAALDAFNRQTQPAAGQGEQQQAPERPLTQADIDRMVSERAATLAATERFNAECNAAYEAGKKDFPDFEDALGNFRLLGGLQPEVVEAALATGEGHRVLYELGKDPDEAARILALPPVKRAVELAKLAMKGPKAKPVSKAPAPVRPIDGAARVTDNPSKMTMDEFVAWREKQEAQRRA